MFLAPSVPRHCPCRLCSPACSDRLSALTSPPSRWKSDGPGDPVDPHTLKRGMIHDSGHTKRVHTPGPRRPQFSSRTPDCAHHGVVSNTFAVSKPARVGDFGGRVPRRSKCGKEVSRGQPLSAAELSVGGMVLRSIRPCRNYVASSARPYPRRHRHTRLVGVFGLNRDHHVTCVMVKRIFRPAEA